MKLRVLFITTEFPWPAVSGGAVRTLSQLRTLAALPEVGEVTVLSVSEHPVTVAQRDTLAAAVPKLVVRPPVPHPIHLWRHRRFVPRVLALRLLGVPYLAAKWDSPALRAAVRGTLREAPIDTVYVDHLGMARYLPEIGASRPRPRVVLDQHNVESAFYAQLADGSRGWRRRLARFEQRAATAFETRALQEADAVVAISQADADHFARTTGVRAHVVPMVMECQRRVRPSPAAPHFCYVGNLGWRPNVAGLDWFCREVWPKVRAQVPQASFEIIGVNAEPARGGGSTAPRAWRVPGVETVGYVEALEPAYDRALGMLAPVLGGSGVRIKVLEGLRAGLPTVTTADGAVGLPLTDGHEVLIASDPDGFAARVVRLVHDADLRAGLRTAGFAYLDAHHSPEAAQCAMRMALGCGGAGNTR